MGITIFRGPIRRMLLLLVLCSALPSFLIIACQGLQHHDKAMSAAEREMALFINNLSSIQDNTTNGIRILLQTLSRVPEVRRQDLSACSRLFAAVIEANPMYGNVHLASLDGEVMASGRPFVPANFAGRKQFRDAVATKQFAVGEYMIGPTFGEPILPFAAPVFDENGQMQAVLLISIRLSEYGKLFEQSAFPPQSFFGMADAQGIRLARFPANDQTNPLGQPTNPTVFNAAKNTLGIGQLKSMNSDGVERLTVFKPFRLGPNQQPYLYMFVGLATSAIDAQARAVMLTDALVLTLVVLLTMASGWYLGASIVGRRFKNLARAAERIGSGDLSVRADTGSGIEEFEMLAASFNNMAVALSRDSTARKLAETALRNSEERFRLLFENAPLPYQSLDDAGMILDVNRMWVESLGYRKNEVVGRLFTDFMKPESVDQFKARFEEFKKAFEVRGLEFELVKRNGESMTVSLSGQVQTDEERRYVRSHCIFFDITERKQNEVALRLAKEDAERANSAKSMFLANMSHEIRTPLNGVIGMLQLLERASLSEKQDRYVKLAHESAHRLLRLLNDILDISRIDAGKIVLLLEPFRPADLLSEAVGMFAMMAKEKGVVLSYELGLDVPQTLIGDQARIMQILFNLVGNAVKFTGQGMVNITLDCLPQHNGSAQRTLLLTVTDTGPGIADDALPKLFYPFSQGDTSFTKNNEGAGLGLAIIRRLASLMGGGICLESEEGRGTSFYVSFKVGQLRQKLETAEAQQSISTETRNALHSPIHVILAEDDETSQLTGKMMLEMFGYEVSCASNGQEVLDLLEKDRYDLVLMDVQMPVRNGVNTTREIRASGKPYAHIPIIAMTAYAMTGDRETFLQEGMNDYIAKPVDMRALNGLIEKTVRGGAQA